MTTTSEVGYNAGQRTFRPVTQIVVCSSALRKRNRLVLLSKLARVTVNANHSIMRAAAQYRVVTAVIALREHIS